MKVQILLGNVRGVNEREKHKVIKALIHSHSADLVCLQETKVHKMSTPLVRSMGVGRFLAWGVAEARGQAWDILVFWNTWVL